MKFLKFSAMGIQESKGIQGAQMLPPAEVRGWVEGKSKGSSGHAQGGCHSEILAPVSGSRVEKKREKKTQKPFGHFRELTAGSDRNELVGWFSAPFFGRLGTYLFWDCNPSIT